MPVVTGRSLNIFQHLNIGANEHSNIVGEWSALAYALMGVIWTAESNPDGIMDIEIRQDCFEVLDVIVNKRQYSANVVLINKVKGLWKTAQNKANIR